MFPGHLYQFQYLKDWSGPVLERFMDRLDASAVANVVTALGLAVPNDRVLCLTALGLNTNPGAGQQLNRWDMGVRRDINQRLAVSSVDQNASALPSGLDYGGFWSGLVWVLPGEQLYATAQFDAGAVANEVQLSAFGMLIPRGNFAGN